MDLELASIRNPAEIGAATATIGLLESSGFRYEAAQSRLLLIDRLLADGSDREPLTRELAELLEIATEHGMTWIAERVSSLAKGARVTISLDPEPDAPETGARSEVEYRHGLTAREIEVMSLLAEGLTNKAIGERLYVSPRTVSTHVSNLLAKLGLSNRGEAAAAFHRLDLGAFIDGPDPAELG
jgi:DNA-binding NarL/FixJ family response regulator